MQVNLMRTPKIENNYSCQPKGNNCPKNPGATSFKGFHGQGKALFVGDLDGTVALGAPTYLAPFLNLLKQCQARLVFASGRSLEKFTELQSELKKSHVRFPTPEFLITQNGAHIYKDVKGTFVEDMEWAERVTQSFDKEKILKSIKEIAFKPENVMPGQRFDGTDDFMKSKLCIFEFWPAPTRVQFIADSSISDKIFREIKDKLQADGINARVIKQRFSREENDLSCNAVQKAIMEPRYGKDGYVTQIDIAAANKGDGVEFVQRKYNIPDEEVIMAGNDANDISMARLTRQNKTFIGVGNRTEQLNKYIQRLINENEKLKDNLVLPQQEGLAGIVEGINKIVQEPSALK